MAKYLDKIARTIGRRQTDQVLNLLNQKRNSGEIRTVEEFSKKLESLVRELTSSNLKPSLSLYKGQVGKRIDSDTYNFMLDRVGDDLFAAFEEADNINEIQQSHQTIIKDLLLKNIRAAISELETKISIYEYLNQDANGFNLALFSTFREARAGRTFRDSTDSKALFVDPRTAAVFSADEDAQIEIVGERLILGNNNKTEYTIHAARQIFDSSTAQSELIVEPPNLSINNTLDGQSGTYWLQALLFKAPRESVTIKVELDLGITQEVNYIDIEPITKYGLVLDSIDYIDNSGTVTQLTANDQAFDGPISVRFHKTAARYFILTFINKHSSAVQFEYSPTQNTLFEQVFLEPEQGFSGKIEDLAKDLVEVIPSVEVRNMIGITEGTKQQFIGYEFLTGFDNFRMGLTDHAETGVYLSAPLEADNVQQLGLKVIESRPYLSTDNTIEFTTQTYDNDAENATRYFLGSIEYWVIKQDFNADNILLRTSIFPILPTNTQKIHHERLVLDSKSDAALSENDLGYTVFFTAVVDGEVEVYRNGALLVYATDWEWNNSAVLSDRTPNQNTDMKFQIKILDVNPNDIFTVTYRPILSTTTTIPTSLSAVESIGGLQIVDMIGDLSVRLGPQQLIQITNQEIDSRHKIYLMIVLRQNTAETALSPAVEEYVLVAANKDSTKFGDA
jgi:hypothetical protein